MRSGVTSLAKSLSKSVAKDGIRVNNLVPGTIYTDRTEEFGEAGAFLLSDAASYISGATLMVDGALSRTVW